MEGFNVKYQIVLIVDLDSMCRSSPSGDSTENSVTCVRLCALKILTHFHRQSGNFRNLQWGFKLCSSNKAGLTTGRSTFRDFDVKNFEDFENELELQYEKRNEKKCSSTNLSCGGTQSFQKQLQECFRDILYEFQWDRPEITSPVKQRKLRGPLIGRGRKQLVHKNENDDSFSQQNLVFLFSNCPHSTEDLHSRFELKTGSNLLHSLLSETVFYQFNDVCHLKLHWVDTAEIFQHTTDISGLKHVHQVLEEVGGSVISLGALCAVHPQHPTVSLLLKNVSNDKSQTCNSKESEVTQCTVALPTSLVISHYLNPYHQSSPDYSQSWLVLKESGGDSCRCPVDISLMSLQTPVEKINHQATDPVQDSIIEVKLPKGQNQQFSNLEVTQTPAQTASSSSQCESLYPRNLLQLISRGTVSTGSIPLPMIQAEPVYIITALPKLTQHLVFNDIIKHLSNSNLHLVVSSNTSSASNILGVLQPLTSTSASLTLISPPHIMEMEKLLWRGSLEEDSNNVSHPSTLLVNKTLKNTNMKYSDIREASDGSQDQFISERVFTTGLLEDWIRPLPALEPLTQALTHIGEEDTFTQEETRMLFHIQRHLIHRKSRRLNRMDHTPRALGRTPRKRHPTKENLQSSPRRSPRKATFTLSPKKSCDGFESKARRAAARKSPRKKMLEQNKRTPRKKLCVGKSTVKVGHKRGQSAPSSRIDMIIQKSKEAQLRQREKEEEEKCDSHPTLPSPKQLRGTPFKKFTAPSVSTLEDLKEHCGSMYCQGADGRANTYSVALAVVDAAALYLAQQTEEDNQTLSDVLQKIDVLVNNKTLKGRYSQDDNQTGRATEYELQVLLHMEVGTRGQCNHLNSSKDTSSTTDNWEEDMVQEIAMLLRAQSFVSSPSFIPNFLKNRLLDRYQKRSGRLLALVYNELLQPLPLQIEGYISQDEDDDLASVQPGTVAPPSLLDSSIGPPSAGTRGKNKIKRYSSFQVPTKRQIAIPIQKEKKQKKKIKTKEADDTTKVRRNLFMEGGEIKTPSGGRGLQRRQSVAVMQRNKPARTPTKHRPHRKRSANTPKCSGRSSLPRTHVTETPAHKQVSNLLWRQQEQRRQRARSLGHVSIIQESPDKAPSKGSPKLRRTPRKVTSGKIIKRSSFYSAAREGQSRNISRYETSQSLPHSDPTRFDRLEARMISRASLISPSSSVSGFEVETPSRRIKPVALFADILKNSPAKENSENLSPLFNSISTLDAVGHNMQSHQKNFDTGRLGLLNARMRGADTVRTPSSNKTRRIDYMTAGNENESSTIKAESIFGISLMSSQSPNSMSLSQVPGGMRTSGMHLCTPKKRTPHSTLVMDTPSKNTRAALLSPHSATPNKILCTPRKMGTPSILCTPIKMGIPSILCTPSKLGTPSKGILGSPWRVAGLSTPKKVCFTDDETRSPVMNMVTPVKCSPRKAILQRSPSLMLSPSRCTRSQMCLFKSPERKGASASPSSRTSLTVTPTKTPPSSINNWHRRKHRNLSPQGSDNISIGKADSPQTSITTFDDYIAKDDGSATDDPTLEDNSLRRKVRIVRKKSLLSPSASSCSVNKTPKRKHSPGDGQSPNFRNMECSKRQRLSTFDSCSDTTVLESVSSHQYFDNTEVFLSASEPVASSAAKSEAGPILQNPCYKKLRKDNAHKSSSDSIGLSWNSSYGSSSHSAVFDSEKRGSSRLLSFPVSGSDFCSDTELGDNDGIEPESASPVFVSPPKIKEHPESADGGGNSPKKCLFPPSTPTMVRKISQDTNTPSPLHTGVKEFSPSLSKSSIHHLVSSPLINVANRKKAKQQNTLAAQLLATDEQSSPFSINTTNIQQSPAKQRPARRSLYRTQTQADM